MEKFETVLPEDFDGVFRFTNATDEDFVGRWNSKDYHFPAQKTTPMHIIDATPLEVQQIRKKFARDLASREFFRSQRGLTMQSQERNTDGTAKFNSIHMAAGYTDNDLAPFIQQCLTPLAIAQPTVTDAPKIDLETVLSKDDEGETVTTAIDRKTSLREKALRK